MQTALLQTKSKTNLKLLLDLADKIGVTTTLLSFEEMEEIGLAKAIQKGRTGKYVNEKEFISRLRRRVI